MFEEGGLPHRRSKGCNVPFPPRGKFHPQALPLLPPQRPFAFAGTPFASLAMTGKLESLLCHSEPAKQAWHPKGTSSRFALRAESVLHLISDSPRAACGGCSLAWRLRALTSRLTACHLLLKEKAFSGEHSSPLQEPSNLFFVGAILDRPIREDTDCHGLLCKPRNDKET